MKWIHHGHREGHHAGLQRLPRAHGSSMAILGHRRDVKRGTLAGRGSVWTHGRRKISAVAAQFERDDSNNPTASNSVEDDAAALRDLGRQVQSTRPMMPAKQQ